MGREWGGGGQFTSNLGPGWTGSCHTRGGIPSTVSKRDSRDRGNWQGELTEGISKGNKEEFRHYLVLLIYECVS
jgi:hypothetical protein